MRRWQEVAGSSVDKRSGIPALPVWDSGVPYCNDRCGHHDGKRCGLLGRRPDCVCAPVVAEMAKLIEQVIP